MADVCKECGSKNVTRGVVQDYEIEYIFCNVCGYEEEIEEC